MRIYCYLKCLEYKMLRREKYATWRGKVKIYIETIIRKNLFQESWLMQIEISSLRFKMRTSIG